MCLRVCYAGCKCLTGIWLWVDTCCSSSQRNVRLATNTCRVRTYMSPTLSVCTYSQLNPTAHTPLSTVTRRCSACTALPEQAHNGQRASSGSSCAPVPHILAQKCRPPSTSLSLSLGSLVSTNRALPADFSGELTRHLTLYLHLMQSPSSQLCQASCTMNTHLDAFHPNPAGEKSDKPTAVAPVPGNYNVELWLVDLLRKGSNSPPG